MQLIVALALALPAAAGGTGMGHSGICPHCSNGKRIGVTIAYLAGLVIVLGFVVYLAKRATERRKRRHPDLETGSYGVPVQEVISEDGHHRLRIEQPQSDPLRPLTPVESPRRAARKKEPRPQATPVASMSKLPAIT
ncbi:hypothetical protein BOTBODRAFT_25897 [Botryobasidium botryosum FD-172 SS1]|uniref:Uncharacterized protein n=1 Tax=Botryobasidium botryosum (strain FD-172 SS1) TaxID=930990 RepID=A0A067N3B7_BOTB1|nr:hypothetical protein BOTBODRAFT_25897 [Botryobasidium botryosum FD-172 SS1]